MVEASLEPSAEATSTVPPPSLPPTERGSDPAGPTPGTHRELPTVAVISEVHEAATLGANGETAEGSPLGTINYFGDYELIGEIARGGMGVVYRTRQVSLNRSVALKLILSSQLASAVDVKRFHVEAEAAANLDHPNIVPIYEVGVHQGQHYFSMKLIEGKSLASRVDELIADPRTAARLVAMVARAVHHAHQRGIIHRDLKPSNILIDRDGQPHVTDFGLAKRIEADSRLTQSGAIMGTPSYMPPEQATGRVGSLTTAVDVYALGAILYELLTGRPPFQAGSVMDTLIQVMEQEPPPPRSINPRANRDLETIALKCLEKDPARRYASAEAVADDLERWLKDEPIKARPVSAPERAVKWVRRRPAIAALSTMIVVLTLGGLIVVFFQWQRAEAARRLAIQQEAATRVAEADARTAHAEADKNRELVALQAKYRYFNQIKMAERYVRASNVSQVEQFLEACPPELRAWEWGHLKLLCHPEQRSFAGESAAFSPDGRFLAIDDGSKGTVTLRDTRTWQPTRSFPVGSHVSCFTLSPDGKRLAAVGRERTIKVWNVADGRELATLKGHTGDYVLDLAFRPRSSQLASAGGRNNLVQGGVMADEVRIWDVDQARLIRTIPDAGHSVAYSPDGARMAVCTEKTAKLGLMGGSTGIVGGALKVLDAATGSEVWAASIVNWSEKEIHYSPDGKRLATSHGRSGEVFLRDAATGKLLQTLRGHKDAVSCLAFSPDGNKLATGGVDKAVKIWSLEDTRELHVYHGHTGAVSSVAFSPDGKTLATAGAERSIRIWDANSEPGTRVLPASEQSSSAMVPSPNAKQLLLLQGSFFGLKYNLVEAESGKLLHTLRSLVFFGGFFSDIKVRFSPDGRSLATTDGKTLVQVWDVDGGKEKATLRGHSQQVTALAFSAGGRIIATADSGKPINLQDLATKGRAALDRAAAESDKTIKVWDVETGHERLTLRADIAPLAMEFSPDGRRLAVVGSGPIRREKITEENVRIHFGGKGAVWEIATGRVVFDVPGQKDQIVAVAFSPDGSRLATSSWDGTIKVVDASDGKELHHLGGHTSYVVSVAFSPDGRRLASGSFDQTIKLWDVATGQEVLDLNTNAGVERVQFSPDGREIAVLTGGLIKLWGSSPTGPPERPAARTGPSH
jgi:WD40 repeat protein